MPEKRSYPVHYPSAWRLVRAVEIAEPRPGSTIIGPFGSNLVATDYRAVGVPVVFVRDIRESGFAWNSDVYVCPDKASRLSAHAVEPGDIVATKMGLPPCIAAVYPPWMSPGIVTADVIRLRPDRRNADGRWLVRAINGHDVQTQVRTITGGVTRPKVTLRDFRELRIPLPPLPEQRRIVEVLDTLDEAIRRTEQLIAKLKQMKQGLLHDLLTCGIDENGKLRDPERHPEQFKKSPLGRIPKEWDIFACSSLCRQITVGIVIQPTQYYREEGIPVLRSANVRDHGVVLDDLKYMSRIDHERLSKSAVAPGDLVTVRSGYPGTTALIPESLREANCVDVIISRPGPKVLSKYLAVWVNSDFGRGQVLRRQGGLAQQHFNVGEMKELLVAVPSIAEQQRITGLWHALVARMGIESEKSAKLRFLKQGLMEDLLTGRVTVTPLLAESTP